MDVLFNWDGFFSRLLDSDVTGRRTGLVAFSPSTANYNATGRDFMSYKPVFDQRLLDLYDRCAHGFISRRQFFDRAAAYRMNLP